MKNFRPDRLCDSVTTRVTTRVTASERNFLEKFSVNNRLSMGEGIRLLVDIAMDQARAKAETEMETGKELIANVPIQCDPQDLVIFACLEACFQARQER